MCLPDLPPAATLAYKAAMAGQIHQINMNYAPAHDRLVLRFNTTDRKVFRFFLTRRFTSQLWDALSKIQEQNPEVRQHDDPDVRKAVKEFKQETTLSKEQFGQRFQEEQSDFPLGEQPILITGFGFTPKSETKAPRMAFQTVDGKQISMGVNDQIIVSMIKLIVQAMPQTDWNLELKGVAPEPAERAAEQIH